MNLADIIRDAAEASPAKPALIFQGRRISYLDLDEQVDSTAAALAGLGVAPGDRVALLTANIPEYVSCFYGILRAGAVACPLNIMLTPRELGHILADAGAKAAVTDLVSLPGVLAIRGRLGDLQTVLVVGGPPAPPGTVSLEEALTDPGDPPGIETEAGDLAIIAYTSGTTAAPKGAMLTHGNLMANLEQMAAIPMLAHPDDVVLLVLPLFHIYALNAVLGPALRQGATSLLVERFHAAETLELSERDGVTVLAGAPPMFSAWLSLPDPVPDLGSVRLAVSGASRLAPETKEAFRRRFGVTIWEGYGLTECAPAVTTNALGATAKGGSIGLPIPGVQIRLVDDHGLDVEDGDPGEILVRGPNVFPGYWNRPEDTAAVFEDGWLKTGDVAYRDEDGYLFLVDRKKDLIIVSGFNVFPQEVEEAIERHPGVSEAAVVGIPDERTGEAVQAWVVPEGHGAITVEEIHGFLRDQLARFKWPKEVRVVQELPHHVTGKVLRRALRPPPPPESQVEPDE